MKTLPTPILLSIVFGIIIIGIVGFYQVTTTREDVPVTVTASTTPNVKNGTYTIQGETFILQNGTASKEIAPGSSAKNTLQIFGEPVYGDFNNDGVKDAALILVNTTGGSGIFYYAVLAIAKNDGYVATNALFLGDRIAPQNINIENGRAVYNYAERKAGEPMTSSPSMGKSLYIHYDASTNQIGEWVKDFEGEADTTKMNLGMKTWVWSKTQMNDGAITTPTKPGAFTLTFDSKGNVTIGTDCNRMGGTYTTKGNALTFGPLMSTKMYCEGSQEQIFAQSLGNIASYFFTSKGELILEIKMDSGTMTFR